eukprot:260043-Pelagomonas_calceolata.AAC.2
MELSLQDIGVGILKDESVTVQQHRGLCGCQQAGIDTPSIRLEAVPSIELETVPSIALEAVPSIELETVPSLRLEAVSSLRLETVPSLRLEAVPSIELETVPSIALEAVPSIELETVPSLRLEAVPSIALETVPSMWLEAVPSIELETVPSLRLEAVLFRLRLTTSTCKVNIVLPTTAFLQQQTLVDTPSSAIGNAISYAILCSMFAKANALSMKCKVISNETTCNGRRVPCLFARAIAFRDNLQQAQDSLFVCASLMPSCMHKKCTCWVHAKECKSANS